MTTERRNAESSNRANTRDHRIDWATAVAAYVTQAQQLQLEMLLCWQAAMAGAGQELWDEWRCHFAGGAPIDG